MLFTVVVLISFEILWAVSCQPSAMGQDLDSAADDIDADRQRKLILRVLF
jgi:hypothetical protein